MRKIVANKKIAKPWKAVTLLPEQWPKKVGLFCTPKNEGQKVIFNNQDLNKYWQDGGWVNRNVKQHHNKNLT